MAKKQKETRDISKFLGLKWDEIEPEVPEVTTICDFCQGDILVSESYFEGNTPDWASEPCYGVFTACKRCVTAAGIKW